MRNEVLWSVMERHRSIVHRYGTSLNVTEALRIVKERYGSVTELLRNRYGKYQFCP